MVEAVGVIREGEAHLPFVLIDVRFRHEVFNAGDEPRIHLVADLVPDAALTALMGRARAIETGYLTAYYARHAVPVRVRRALGLRGN